MAGNLFIERQADGKYAVKRPNAQRASSVHRTQAEAIEAAQRMDPDAGIHVERVRHTDVGSPDKWRKL